jgi:hypothetical protein
MSIMTGALTRVVAAMLLAGLVASGCTAGPHGGPASETATLKGRPARIVPPGGAYNVSTGEMGDVSTGELVSFGSVPVCLDRPGKAAITSVGLIRASGISVVDFEVRPSPVLRGKELLGNAPGSLSDNGFPHHRDVNWACPTKVSPRVYEFGITLKRTGSGPGETDGFNIQYQSDDISGALQVPLTIILCAGLPGNHGCEASK